MLFKFSSGLQNKKGSFNPKGIKKKHSTTLSLDENNQKLAFLNVQVGVITRTKANSLGTLGEHDLQTRSQLMLKGWVCGIQNDQNSIYSQNSGRWRHFQKRVWLGHHEAQWRLWLKEFGVPWTLPLTTNLGSRSYKTFCHFYLWGHPARILVHSWACGWLGCLAWGWVSKPPQGRSQEFLPKGARKTRKRTAEKPTLPSLFSFSGRLVQYAGS